MKKRIEIYITGRVQGVMFRQSVKNFADKNNILGFAENLTDGTVKVLGVGNANDLLKLFSFAHRGSMLSKVKTVKGEWVENEGEVFLDFSIIRNEGSILHDQKNALINLAANLTTNEGNILPNHIVIIPDGNRRWAKNKNMPLLLGYKKSGDRMKELIKYLGTKNINHVTVWLFSTENWDRSDDERKILMDLFTSNLKEMAEIFHANKIKFRHFGRRDRLAQAIIDSLEKLEWDTNNYGPKNINFAFDYGGRDEIIRAIRKIENPKEITGEEFNELLDTNGVPDPDLIIRTSGEMRISGIMPWQTIYSELYFSDKLFPDFDNNEVENALTDFSNRKRRFGK